MARDDPHEGAEASWAGGDPHQAGSNEAEFLDSLTTELYDAQG